MVAWIPSRNRLVVHIAIPFTPPKGHMLWTVLFINGHDNHPRNAGQPGARTESCCKPKSSRASRWLVAGGWVAWARYPAGWSLLAGRWWRGGRSRATKWLPRDHGTGLRDDLQDCCRRSSGAATAKLGEGFVNNRQIRKFARNKYLFIDCCVCH